MPDRHAPGRGARARRGARSDLFYALLLKDAGCTANSARMAALFGADDHDAKHTAKRVDWARPLPAFAWSLRTVAPGGSLRMRMDRLLAIKDAGEVTRSLMQARCDRGAEIALHDRPLRAHGARLSATLDEHWDGGGQPRGLRGDEIPLLGRILCLAQTRRDLPRGGRRRGRLRRGHADAAAAGSTRRSSTRSARSATTRRSGGRSTSRDISALGAARTGC